MKTLAVIVAAGAGIRAAVGPDAVPKQFRTLGGRTVLDRAAAPFLAHPRVDGVLVVTRPGWEDRVAAALPDSPRLLAIVAGGERRQDSVRLGLEAAVAFGPDRALIHDAARPFASAALIDRVLDGISEERGAIPALPVAETLKRGRDGTVVETVERAGLHAAQTPQGFPYWAVRAAHQAAAATGREFTDDAAIAEWAGVAVGLVAGDPMNRKLTTPEDFDLAEVLIAAGPRAPAFETRIGTGFDVHRFGDGASVTLCGIAIPHARGLSGHSDADVGLHAITDALLGAIADGDIGSHFPPSDPRWKGANSQVFLAHAADLVRARGGRIVNVDVTIICEAPRIGPHREAMRARVAGILGLSAGRVAVKATTSEELGFTGRREGIAAQAVAAVALPSEEVAP